MNVNDFIRIREKDWQRLQALVDKRRGRGRLSAAEAWEMGYLYRAVTSDLALARRDYQGQRVTRFLNQLLTQAHSLIYQQDTANLRALLRYFTQVIPRTFRRAGWFTLAAVLLFAVPAIVGYGLTFTNPDVARPLGLEAERASLANARTWTDIPLQERPYASAFIMGTNIRVSILAFAGGVSFGLFTVYLLATNGLVIGAVLGLTAHYDMSHVLLDFIIAHSVVELSVIFFAGGAGLVIGWALLNPGPYRRRDSLVVAARRVVPLVVLAIPLLVFSGLLEGFLSPSAADFAVKVLAAVGSGLALYIYLLLAGRPRAA